MNQPEYIVVDEIGTIVTAVKAALGLTTLNYQYGYIRELNETLQQWSADPAFAVGKYPCVYLLQPFTVKRGGNGDYFGEVSLRCLIINECPPDAKAKDRMTNNYKAVLYPIYRELIKQLTLSGVFTSAGDSLQIEHEVTDRYYWGEDQQSVLSDKVDVLDIDGLQLKIYNNLNCS